MQVNENKAQPPKNTNNMQHCMMTDQQENGDEA